MSKIVSWYKKFLYRINLYKYFVYDHRRDTYYRYETRKCLQQGCHHKNDKIIGYSW